MKKYVVEQGDTMWSISEATGVKPNLLLAANPQVKNPNQLRPGTIIVVPELKKSTLPPLPTAAGSSTSTPGMAQAAPPTAEQYAGAAPSEVSVGPSLDLLPTPKVAATAPKVPVAAVKSGTPSATSKAGTGVPSFFGFVWPHVVQPGETWESIQTKYSVSAAHLEQLNPSITSRGIHPGDIVYVPGMIPDAVLTQLGSAMPQAQLQAVPASPGVQGYSGVHGGHQSVYGAQQSMYGVPGVYGPEKGTYGAPGVYGPGHGTYGTTGVYGTDTGMGMYGMEPMTPAQTGAPSLGNQPGAVPAYPGAVDTKGLAPEVGTSGYPEMGPHEHNPYRGTEFDSDTFAWPKQGSSSISVFLGESTAEAD